MTTVVMNLLMGRAVAVQLAEFSLVSYQPLAEAFRAIAPVEARHAELAEEGLAKLLESGDRDRLQASVSYWWPRVSSSFGTAESQKAETLKAMGLRRSTNTQLRARWEAETREILTRLGMQSPA